MSLFNEAACSRCGSKEHSTENCPHQKGIFLSEKACRHCGSNDHPSENCPHSRGIFTSESECRHCGSKEHGSAQCPHPRGLFSSEKACRHCGSIDHSSNSCPHPKGLFTSEKACKNCGSKNHSTLLCPHKKNNSAIGILIGIAIVIFILLALFSYPYKLVSSDFSPFSMNWLDNSDVWIFASVSWIFLGSLIAVIKLSFADRQGENRATYFSENGMVSFIMLLLAMPLFFSYIIKARVQLDFLITSSITLTLLAGLTTAFFLKTAKGAYFIAAVVLSSVLSIYYVNDKDFANAVIDSTYIEANDTEDLPSGNTGSSSTISVELNEESAKEKFILFNNALISESESDLANLISDGKIIQYMKLKNISKKYVLTDKRNYLKRWQVSECSYYDFKKINSSEYSYILKTSVTRKDETRLKRNFLVKGIIGFDNFGLINKINDTQTIKLNPDKSISISDLYEIPGSKWIFENSSDMSPSYVIFNPDGNYVLDLDNDKSYQWTIENNQLVFGKKHFSTITCSIENGVLSCSGQNINGVEWTSTGYMQKK